MANENSAAQPWSFALFALVTTAAIISVALLAPPTYEWILGWLDTSLDPAGTREPSPWGQLLSFQVAVIAFTGLMAGVAGGRDPSIGWRQPVGRLSWWRPFCVTAAVSALIAAVGFTFFPDQIARDLAPIRQMVEAGPLVLAFLALTVGAPLSEELLFRGYLLHRLKQTPLGFWGAALIANAGWTAMHVGYSWLSLADVFIAGLLFSWALWRTKSIWVPIAFHALYNAIVFAILLIPASRSSVPAMVPVW